MERDDSETGFRSPGPWEKCLDTTRSDLFSLHWVVSWWALAWLRGTELATDIVWSSSPAFSRPGARAGLWFAGASNLAMALGFAWLARGQAKPKRRLFGRR